MLNGKAMIVPLTVGLTKIHSLNGGIFSKTKIIRRKSESWIRFELNWIEFAKGSDLAYLKSTID